MVIYRQEYIAIVYIGLMSFCIHVYPEGMHC